LDVNQFNSLNYITIENFPSFKEYKKGIYTRKMLDMYDKLIRNINKKHTYDEFVEFVEIYKNIANKAG
jgi:hypothetical protein